MSVADNEKFNQAINDDIMNFDFEQTDVDIRAGSLTRIYAKRLYGADDDGHFLLGEDAKNMSSVQKLQRIQKDLLAEKKQKEAELALEAEREQEKVEAKKKRDWLGDYSNGSQHYNSDAFRRKDNVEVIKREASRAVETASNLMADGAKGLQSTIELQMSKSDRKWYDASSKFLSENSVDGERFNNDWDKHQLSSLAINLNDYLAGSPMSKEDKGKYRSMSTQELFTEVERVNKKLSGGVKQSDMTIEEIKKNDVSLFGVEFEKYWDDSRQERINLAFADGDIDTVMRETILNAGYDLVGKLIEMKLTLGRFPGGKFKDVGHVAGTLGYAGTVAAKTYVMTPGDDSEKMESALTTFAYMGTPAISAYASKSQFAVFAFDFLLNSGISYGTGQINDSIDRGYADAEAIGKPEEGYKLAMAYLAPVIGSDVIFSAMTKSARSQTKPGDPARINAMKVENSKQYVEMRKKQQKQEAKAQDKAKKAWGFSDKVLEVSGKAASRAAARIDARTVQMAKDMGKMNSNPIGYLAKAVIRTGGELKDYSIIAADAVARGIIKSYDHFKEITKNMDDESRTALWKATEQQVNKFDKVEPMKIVTEKEALENYHKNSRTKKQATTDQEGHEVRKRIRSEVPKIKLSTIDKGELKHAGIKVSPRYLSKDGLGFDQVLSRMSDTDLGFLGLTRDSEVVDLVKALYSGNMREVAKGLNKEVRASDLEVGDQIRWSAEHDAYGVVVAKEKDGSIIVNPDGEPFTTYEKYPAKAVITEKNLISKGISEEDFNHANYDPKAYSAPDAFEKVPDGAKFVENKKRARQMRMFETLKAKEQTKQKVQALKYESKLARQSADHKSKMANQKEREAYRVELREKKIAGLKEQLASAKKVRKLEKEDALFMIDMIQENLRPEFQKPAVSALKKVIDVQKSSSLSRVKKALSVVEKQVGKQEHHDAFTSYEKVRKQADSMVKRDRKALDRNVYNRIIELEKNLFGSKTREQIATYKKVIEDFEKSGATEMPEHVRDAYLEMAKPATAKGLSTQGIKLLEADVKSLIETGRTVFDIRKEAEKKDRHETYEAIKSEKKGKFATSGRKAKDKHWIDKGVSFALDPVRLHERAGKRMNDFFRNEILPARTSKLEMMEKVNDERQAIWKDVLHKHNFYNFAKDENGQPFIVEGEAKTLVEVAAIYAYSKNDHTRNIMKGNGIDDAFIERVEKALPSDIKQAVEEQLALHDNVIYPAYAQEFYRENNKILPQQENYMTAYDVRKVNASEVSVKNELFQAATGMNKGQGKDRVKNQNGFESFDLFRTIDKTINDAVNYATMNKVVDKGLKILSKPDIQKHLKSLSPALESNLHHYYTNEGRGGIAKDGGMLDKLSAKVSIAALGGNIGTVVPTQLVSGLNGAVSLREELGMNIVKANALIAKNIFSQIPKNVVTAKFDARSKEFDVMMSESAQMRDRDGSMNINFRQLQTMAKHQDRLSEVNHIVKRVAHKLGVPFEKAGEMIMKTISIPDRLAVTAIYTATRDAALKQKNRDGSAKYTKAEAIEKAEMVIRKSQPMGDIASLPQSFTHKNSYIRSFTKFSTVLNKTFNQITGAKARSMMLDYPLAIALASVVPNALIWILKNGRPPEEEEDILDMAKGIAGANLSGSLPYLDFFFGDSAPTGQIIGGRKSRIERAVNKYDADEIEMWLPIIAGVLESGGFPGRLIEKGHESMEEDSLAPMIYSEKKRDKIDWID